MLLASILLSMASSFFFAFPEELDQLPPESHDVAAVQEILKAWQGATALLLTDEVVVDMLVTKTLVYPNAVN